MNSKNTFLVIILAAVVGFGVGFLIYNQTKEAPSVVDDFSAGQEDHVSQIEIADNIKVILQQSPLQFLTIVSEGAELTKNQLPQSIRELVPSDGNQVTAKEAVFSGEQGGFVATYISGTNLYNSHKEILTTIRASSVEWNEIYVARGAHGAVIDISSDSYQARIIQESAGDSATKINLMIIEL